jgi:phosphocarrier protein
MVEREVEVMNSLGLHARPSSMIVQTAQKYTSTVSIVKSGAVADAKSIMNVMILAATRGTKVIIRTSGPDEVAAADAIENLFLQKFNEE